MFEHGGSDGNILDVQNVTVSFDGFKVLDGLNFSIRRGELRFLIGPNGAGKTTLLDIVTGKTRPRSGRVLFDDGRDIRRCTLVVWRGKKSVIRMRNGESEPAAVSSRPARGSASTSRSPSPSISASVAARIDGVAR